MRTNRPSNTTMKNRDIAVGMMVSYAVTVAGGFVGSSGLMTIGGWALVLFSALAVIRLYPSNENKV